MIVRHASLTVMCFMLALFLGFGSSLATENTKEPLDTLIKRVEQKRSNLIKNWESLDSTTTETSGEPAANTEKSLFKAGQTARDIDPDTATGVLGTHNDNRKDFTRDQRALDRGSFSDRNLQNRATDNPLNREKFRASPTSR